jgi:putative glutamine amidotransferase
LGKNQAAIVAFVQRYLYMAPVIGVTYGYDVGDDCTNNYIHAVRDHGGIPYPVYPGVPDFNFAELDGLLLTGGGDIHPDNFGEEWHPTLKSVDEDRDGLEIPLCQQALEADLPVFGICRGIQIMSVAMGGNLYQDIPSEYSREALPHKIEVGDARHNIQIQPDSLLSELVSKTADEVNSSHHQAVGEIGGEFVITARSEDGIVEAMEDRSKRFVLGVQYHPERMLETPEFREHRRMLFEAFIKAASR